MAAPRPLHYFGYVHSPFEKVRALLHHAPLQLLHRATVSAASRAQSVAVSLRLGVEGAEIAVDVRTHLRRIHDDESVAGMPPSTSLDLAWEAVCAPSLFPLMEAVLSASPVTAAETQLEIEAHYRPPFGPAGNVLDAAVGRRIAQATVHRFFEDVLERIRLELAAASQA
jgi:hypothetical protein